MPAGPWARLVVLLGTLLGLAAMHTLGHGAHASGADPAAHPVAGHAVSAAAAMGTTADCPGDGCGHHAAGPARAAGPATAVLPLAYAPARVLPLGDPGGEPSGWSVCLAVLGAFAVVLLIAVSLRAGSRASGPAPRGALRPAWGPRAPPVRPYGLRLVAASVLRR